MNKLIAVGRSMFAAGIIALGFLCIINEDFIIGRPPAWPSGFDLNPALAYITGAIIILAGIAILVNKNGGYAALIIALLILLLSVVRSIPGFMDHWLNAYKTIAFFGGALIIACSYFSESPGTAPKFMSGKNTLNGIVFFGSALLAVFFIACGYAHFKFDAFVKDFIPKYIPFHGFFTYFCAICLIAGGAGLLIPATRKWAALLSGIMVGGWFLLLHIPRFIANTNDASDRMGLCESFAFAGIFFCLAGMSEKKDQAGRRTVNPV
jgi:uncharacterized membrane protein